MLHLNEVTREVIALSLSNLQRNWVVLSPNSPRISDPSSGIVYSCIRSSLNLLRNASDAMGDVEDRPRATADPIQR